MQLKSFSYKTKDGIEHWINRWIPDSDVQIKAVIQLNHGLSEHSLRYDRFGSILAENGFVLKIPTKSGTCKYELVEEKEPGHVGADICVGSLMKNLGGGIASTGGYIAGKKELVELAAERLTAPGEGREVGPSLGLNRSILQGLFMAPQVVTSALKTSILTSYVLEKLGKHYDICVYSGHNVDYAKFHGIKGFKFLKVGYYDDKNRRISRKDDYETMQMTLNILILILRMIFLIFQ